jgi:hypothetical protein
MVGGTYERGRHRESRRKPSWGKCPKDKISSGVDPSLSSTLVSAVEPGDLYRESGAEVDIGALGPGSAQEHWVAIVPVGSSAKCCTIPSIAPRTWCVRSSINLLVRTLAH